MCVCVCVCVYIYIYFFFFLNSLTVHVHLAGSQFPDQGSKLMLLAVKAWGPNHWTSREFPIVAI